MGGGINANGKNEVGRSVRFSMSYCVVLVLFGVLRLCYFIVIFLGFVGDFVFDFIVGGWGWLVGRGV